jgi:hypothetical protein
MFALNIILSVLIPVAFFATIAIVGEQRRYRRMEASARAPGVKAGKPGLTA